MFAVGTFYLAFEEKILATGRQSSSVQARTSLNARLILSVQVRSAK